MTVEGDQPSTHMTAAEWNDYHNRKRDAERDYREQKLQMHIVEKHKTHFPHVMMTISHAGGKDKKDGELIKKMGRRKGTSDILLWWDKGAGAQEVKPPEVIYPNGEKKPAGKESPEQKVFGFMLTRMGHHYAACWSWREYYQNMLAFGIIPFVPCSIFDEPNYYNKEDMAALAHDFNKP